MSKYPLLNCDCCEPSVFIKDRHAALYHRKMSAKKRGRPAIEDVDVDTEPRIRIPTPKAPKVHLLEDLLKVYTDGGIYLF